MSVVKHYTKSISMGLKQAPLVGKSSLSQRIPYWRFHCIDNTKNNTAQSFLEL